MCSSHGLINQDSCFFCRDPSYKKKRAREEWDLAWGLAGLLPMLLLSLPAGQALGTSALSSSLRVLLQPLGVGLYPLSLIHI